MNKEDLRDLLKQQVEKFEGEKVHAYTYCAFCHASVRAGDYYCTRCPFPFPAEHSIPVYERCLRQAILDGQTDKECLAGQKVYPPARAKLWAEWYRAWLDSPTLTPPPLEWKEEE